MSEKTKKQMENKKENAVKGITLIALVVTIVILIILATISVQVVLGENGLIKRAERASELKKDVDEDEHVKFAIYSALMEGKGKLLKDNVKKALQEEFGEEKVTDDNFTGEENGPWTFEGERKNYTIGANGTVEELPEKTVVDLKAGDWVLYKGNGEDIYCRVLYDTEYNNTNGTKYGVQIISADIVTSVTLGGETDKEALDSYNDAIETLNQKASSFINPNTDYVISARCIGSVPNEPASQGDLIPHVEEDHCFLPNSKYRETDENYVKDMEQMQKINKDEIFCIKSDYWLASRFNSDDFNGGFDEFGIRNYYAKYMNVSTEYPTLICLECDNEGRRIVSSGLRPVFTLKDDVVLKGGDGKTESTAYKLEL